MKRIILLLLLVITIAVMVWFTSSTITPAIKTVGVIMYRTSNQPTFEGFKTGLAELGHVEGKNIRYIFNGSAMDKEQLDIEMQRLLAAEPDIIFACTTPAALAAKKATEGTNLPVVFAPVNDPVATGVLKDIQAPEGNLTGIRLAKSDGKRLQSLIEVMPTIRRVFVPYNPLDGSALASLQQLKEALPKLNIELISKEFGKDVDLSENTIYVPRDIDAIMLPREGLVISYNKDFVALCNSRKIPLSVPRFLLVEQGALTGYCFMGREMGRQAARMAHVLLSGTPVSNVPVETARDYLFINLKTAKTINAIIPDAVLRRAHEIIR